ncbi:hypothetical protein OB955_05255 [Halobacteria archaeon AArc-m2/3/4]|uniref:Uncharacterized protein n=1 Tax=Natronoglomus mannanivorans TaxID=2979990 RepID=A0AAP2Z1W3_9EURY|nr:hypothetical protein [Halobacteria archaeon AArc-xg1-1]MCU4972140.1 hypothetical protein [Halobacteria archaeon AArc-m2/3/4]
MASVSAPVLSSVPHVVAQLEPATGGLLAYLGTFVIATIFYGLTLHIAARYVLGDVSVRRAFRVAPVLALFLIVLQQAGPAITAGVSLVVAYTLIYVVYDLGHKMTAFVTVIYYTVALLLGIVIYNIVFLIGQAPG